MKRRNALRNMALAVGGLVTLPAWANGWNAAAIGLRSSLFSPNQDALLAEIVETIIPATDTLGAKDLKIHAFVQNMIADCYEPEVQQNVLKGLETTEQLAKQTYGKLFAACETAQREEVLTRMEISIDQNWSSFYKLIKELTLQGYLTSEYYLTKHSNYKMMPGHLYGCVPVPTPQTQLQK